jgi:peptidoglycan-associated lipoprotein
MKMNLASRTLGTFICVAAAAAMLATGCGAKKKGSGVGDQEYGAGGSAGIGEEGLSGGSSMEQFEQTGTVAGGGVYRDIAFQYDSYQLDDAGMDAVRQNASILQSDAARRIEIEGHCDERGTSEYNLALGAKRARTVKEALVGLGVTGDRLDTVSYGEELPLCRDTSETCYAMNRRAHFVDR